MEPWFDTTSEDDPFTGFEDPLSYTWLENTVAPHFWEAQHEDLDLAGCSNLQISKGLNPEAMDHEPVETWLQRTASSSQISEHGASSLIDASTTDSGNVSRNTSNSSLQSFASSTNSLSKRGRRIKNGYACDKCKDTFDLPSELNHHGKKHLSKHARPFACAHCDERFVYPKDLRRHMRRKHPGAAEDVQGHASDSLGTFSTNDLGTDITPVETTEESIAVGLQDKTMPGFVDDELLSIAKEEDGLMMKPRKKRKAKHVVVEDDPAPNASKSTQGQTQNHLVFQDADRSGESSKPEASEKNHASICRDGRMSRKQRTKVWLKSAKVLFEEAEGLPPSLADMFVHSLDTMAQNVDVLVVDETKAATGRVEARAALSVVVEYFERPGSGKALALDEKEMLTCLMERLKL